MRSLTKALTYVLSCFRSKAPRETQSTFEKRYRFFPILRFNVYVDIRADSLEDAKKKLIAGSMFATWEELGYDPWFIAYELP
jgi:hypothetical protein